MTSPGVPNGKQYICLCVLDNWLPSVLLKCQIWDWSLCPVDQVLWMPGSPEWNPRVDEPSKPVDYSCQCAKTKVCHVFESVYRKTLSYTR